MAFRHIFISLILSVLGLFCTAIAEEATESTPVTITPLSKLAFIPTQSAPAVVVSLNHSNISARLSASITSLPLKPGDTVKKGDVVAQLDCDDAELARQAARSRLSLAEKEFKRTKALRKSNNIAEQLLNQAETEMRQAKIALQQTALQVSRCTVYAPFDGVVIDRLASEGELAAPGTVLLSLLDTNRLELAARIPANHLQSLQSSSALHFDSESQTWPVTLRTVLPLVNTAARTQEARLAFKDKAALPGKAGRLTWQLDKPHLPANLLLERDGKIGIMVLDESSGTADFISLEEAKQGHPAATDLANDTPLIIDGRFGLQHGDAVTILSPQPAS